MGAAQVQAAIAAGLAHPELLARWRAQPERLRPHGVDPEALDLTALWKFAGLALKVRHNGLRGDLPWTFRLLDVAGREIDVFASYASFRASGTTPLGDTAEARTRDLLVFLEQWLDFDRRDHALLWDMIRHEATVARLGQLAMPASTPTVDGPAVAPSPSSVPRRRGEAMLHVMRSDPRAVASMLREKAPRLDHVALGTFHFAYARTTAAPDIHILELDELGFYLISVVDGRRSVADVSEQLGAGRRPARALVRACEELAALGVLTFHRAGDLRP